MNTTVNTLPRGRKTRKELKKERRINGEETINLLKRKYRIFEENCEIFDKVSR